MVNGPLDCSFYIYCGWMLQFYKKGAKERETTEINHWKLKGLLRYKSLKSNCLVPWMRGRGKFPGLGDRQYVIII